MIKTHFKCVVMKIDACIAEQYLWSTINPNHMVQTIHKISIFVTIECMVYDYLL